MAQRLAAAVSDRFRIERHLGTGGMASVWLAQDLRHDRPVAFKIILPEIAAVLGPDRFRREVRVTAGLSHPNIRPLLDSGAVEGLLYYVQPYIEGETLEERIARDRPLGVEHALRVAHEIADALAYAHAHGVVHRDVKPGNVFLEGDHAVLGDFGLALVMESADAEKLTSNEVMLGTAEYMSPEQCSGESRADQRSDVYSLGCVLYEMLTGEPPFLGRSYQAVIAKQMTEAPSRVSTLRPDVPSTVEDLVQRCLAKTPADRYHTAAQLKTALEVVLGEAGMGLYGPAAARPSMWSRWALSASALAVLVLAVVLWPLVAPPEVAALDPEKVVVFPLADRGGGAAVGEDCSIMIGNALLNTDPLRWIDGWLLIAPEQRDDVSLLALDSARALARANGAGHFIVGGVAGAGDSVSVRLSLYDTAGDSLVAQGAAGDVLGGREAYQLAIQAVVQVLPALMNAGPDADVSSITDRVPAAITEWILGEKEYRSGRFAAALDHFRTAVAVDSLVVFAALKGARAAAWSEGADEAAELLALALRHPERLPARYRSFAQGLDAFSRGSASEAVAHYRSALEADPAWAEAWAGLGEVYQHLLPPDLVVGHSAPDAFREALRWDPDFVPAMIHLAEEAFRLGEVDEGREWATRVRTRLDTTGVDAHGWLAVMESCAVEGRPMVGDSAAMGAVLSGAQRLAAGGRQLACAEEAFRHALGRADLTPGWRWLGLMGLQGILLAQGRFEELSELLEGARAAGLQSVNFLYALDVVAGAPLDSSAQAVDGMAASAWGPAYEAVGPHTAWLLALWNAWEGDLATLTRLLSRLQVLQDANSGEAALRRAAFMAAAAEGHAHLARGDTAQALESFQALESVVPYTDLRTGLAESLAAERILLAELLLATGRAEEAHRVASTMDHPEPTLFLAFLPRSLEIRVRAAEAMEGSEWSRRAQEARDRLFALGREDVLSRLTQGGRP